MQKSAGIKRQSAFTLLEITTVISILALLTTLLFPCALSMIARANRVKCQGNLRQISTALFSYTADHNGRLPVAAPHELGGPQGKVSSSDPWLPARMFGGALPAEERPLNAYVSSPQVFRSPCDRGEPLWWFDTATYQKKATCFELYGSSYFYASGYNRIGGVLAPMGIAKFIGTEFSYKGFASNPLLLGESVPVTAYPYASKKIIVASIPIHRTMSGIVAISERARWYKENDAEHLWANAAYLDGHLEFVRVFPYDRGYQSVFTIPDEHNPYF
ncbi:MAG: type II secretion system protein [Chthoniobacterales bacterium]